MSKYTTEVRYICEYYAGLTESVGYDGIDDVIAKSYQKVLGDFPLFDEKYRQTLCTKILKHYYTREICEETVGLWRLRINNRLNEIMPYYNKLYSSELLKFNPLYDIDLTTTHTRAEDTKGTNISTRSDEKNDSRNTTTASERNTTNNEVREGTTATNGNTETENIRDITTTSENATKADTTGNTATDNSKKQNDRYSDTPQGGLSGIESDTYLTNARIIDGNESNSQSTNQHSEGSGNSTGTEKGNNTETVSASSNEQINGSTKGEISDSSVLSGLENLKSTASGTKQDDNNVTSTESYLEQVQGKHGGISYAKMLMEYRDSFLNIDTMIIENLNDLFFGLWD